MIPERHHLPDALETRALFPTHPVGDYEIEHTHGNVHIVNPVVAESRLSQRIEQITGLQPQLIENTETGDWIAVVLAGESEALVWAQGRIEALRALCRRLEGSR